MIPETTEKYLPLATGDRSLFKAMRETARDAAAIMLLVLLPIFSGISTAYAQTDERKQAEAYLRNQEYDKAYEALYELFKKDPGDPELNFLLGRAAFENRDYESAVMAFERVLIVNPDADRVKLEMARCLYHLGSVETARQYFEEVLAAGPPPNVRDNILRYLSAIRASRKEHFISGRFTCGVEFNDNANVAPTSTEIEITTALGYVIPVTVDRPVKDQIYNSTLNLNYLYKPMQSPLAWKVSGINYNAIYRDVDGLDVNLYDLKAGLYLPGKRISWELYGLTNQLDLNYKRYQRSYGAGTGGTILLKPSMLLSMNGNYRKKDYVDANDRDADNISINIGPVVSIGPNRFTATLGWELEHADEDVNTYNRENAIITYDRALPYGFACALAYWYQKTDYKDESTLFNEKRSDDVQYMITSLSKTLWHSKTRDTALFVNIGYTYTRSDSNIALYEYTKNALSTALSIAF